MIKKTLLIIILLICVSLFEPVFAKSAQVTALSPINTANPPKTLDVKFIEDAVLPDATVLKKDFIMKSNVTNVVSPKRLKKDATFTLNPLYYIDTDGEKHNFTNKIKAKYTTELDKGKTAKSVALGVGSHFVKGLSIGVAAIEGAVDNDEGNVAKSAAKAAYEASPFSYAKKGQDLDIKINDKFLLKFEIEEEQLPNYNFEQNVKK